MPEGSAISWDDFRFFDEVIRAGSIRAAARALGVDHATVSRRLAQLESAFAVKLLVRHPSGVKLTTAGEELQAATVVARGEFQSVERKIRGRDAPLSGRIRLSTHRVLGDEFLIPSIAGFRASHPDIDIDVDLSPDVVDLALNQADVAVRVTQAPPQDTIARRGAGFGYAVYGSVTYLGTHDPVGEPTECAWVGWDERAAYPAELKADGFAEVPIRDRLPSILAQVEAAASGLGLAALPCFLADAQPRLQRLSEPREMTAVYVLRHPDHRSTARVRALYEHIKDFISEHSAALEGRSG